jgi:hypothetical protein
MKVKPQIGSEVVCPVWACKSSVGYCHRIGGVLAQRVQTRSSVVHMKRSPMSGWLVVIPHYQNRTPSSSPYRSISTALTVSVPSASKREATPADACRIAE